MFFFYYYNWCSLEQQESKVSIHDHVILLQDTNSIEEL